MKTKRATAILGVFFLLISSCQSSEEGELRQFWAMDTETNKPYSINALLQAEGEHCKIWVDQSLQLNTSKLSALSALASTYDKKMRPVLLDALAVEGPFYDGARVVAQNSLDFADYFADGDQKLSILVLDIPAEFVAGYFWPGSLFEDFNGVDLIYMDAERLGKFDFEATLVHEAQHLMNFMNSVYFRLDVDQDGQLYIEEMDTWINEGLSAAAEYLYSEKHSTEKHNLERVAWFIDFDNLATKDGSEMDKGNNFFVWDEKRESPNAIFDEYATVYVFFQWLRLQAGGTQIYKDISNSGKWADYRAVVNALQGKGNYSNDNKLDWPTLLRDWLVANTAALSSKSLKYSYKGDALLEKHIGWKGHRQTSPSIQLYPGEGVYSYTLEANTYGSGGKNIRYTGVDFASSGLDLLEDGTSYAGGILISYNANTTNFVVVDAGEDEDEKMRRLQEPAAVSTAIPPSLPSRYSISSQNSHLLKNMVDASQSFSRPRTISIWDRLRQNGHKREAFEPFRRKVRTED